MKICYVCSDRGVTLAKHNGSAAHVRGLLRAFNELGHETLVILSDPCQADGLSSSVTGIPRSGAASLVADLLREEGGGRDERTLARALAHLWANAELERVLARALARRPDLVYERHSPFSVVGPLLAMRAGVPHILEVNAPLAWEGQRHRGQALSDAAHVLERMAFKAATRIVAVSEELREWLMEHGVDGGKIRVIPNGVDPSRFAPDGPVRRAAPEGSVVVAFVGSLKPWHGVDVLAQAFRQLSDHPDLHLLILGEGPLEEVGRALREEFPGRVSLPGAVPDDVVPEYLRGVDIAVAPYPELEVFYFSPIKVLEYMAAGRAIVCSRVGQLRTLVRHDETGIHVPPGDVTALACAIRRLADSPELRGKLGGEARKQAQAAHTWRRRASDILKLCAPAPASVEEPHVRV